MMKKIMIFIGAMFLSALLLYGCSEDGENSTDGNYDIFYINKERTGLISEKYLPSSAQTKLLVEELLEKMESGKGGDEFYKIKSGIVEIKEVKITDKLLELYFTSSYNEMDSITELLCRASYIFTLTQIPEIDYVGFYVDDQPLLDRNGSPIGNMKSDDFVDLNGSSLKVEQTITTVLYYANKAGDKLIPYTYQGTYDKNESMEQFIIEKLMEDAPQDNLYRTIPENVKLINIASKDGICYVNLDESFLVESLNITDEVAIYSIVNSLCETNYITKVQISIGGETNRKFHESISLEKMFVRNLDIVEEETK